MLHTCQAILPISIRLSSVTTYERSPHLGLGTRQIIVSLRDKPGRLGKWSRNTNGTALLSHEVIVIEGSSLRASQRTTSREDSCGRYTRTSSMHVCETLWSGQHDFTSSCSYAAQRHCQFKLLTMHRTVLRQPASRIYDRLACDSGAEDARRQSRNHDGTDVKRFIFTQEPSCVPSRRSSLHCHKTPASSFIISSHSLCSSFLNPPPRDPESS